MFHEAHESPIASLARHIEVWKKRTGLSNAAIADEIVKKHESTGGPARTGIRFSKTHDAYNDMKANQMRIWRWLDDVTDNKNLMSVNFLPSAVAALPMDLKISYWNELLSRDGFQITGIEAGEGVFGIANLVSVMKEDSEAHQALARVIASPTDIDALKRAQKELAESAEATKQAGHLIGAMIRAKTIAGKLLHPFRRSEVTQ